jgi:hypothetical protein
MKTKSESENLKERRHLENLEVDEGIILKWVKKQKGVRMLTGFI